VERRPDRVPQPLGSYIEFARNLPTVFDDHTWLAETADGTAVATGACWSNAAGDARVMESDVCVRQGSTVPRLVPPIRVENTTRATVMGRRDL